MPSPKQTCPHCGATGNVSGAAPGVALVCPVCGKVFPTSSGAATKPLWYFANTEQQVYGPFSWTRLQELAAQRRLFPEYLLWEQGTIVWRVAGTCPGLFSQTPPPAGATPASSPPAIPSPATPDEEDVLASAAPAEGQGPLSMRGIKVGPLRNVSLGDLQILKKLGAGAMGAVYLARQRGENRLVALKVLGRHLALRPGFLARFYREATVMSRLEHPNIVKLYGVGEKSAFHYLAMEYIDGFTVSALLRRRGGQLKVGDALHIALVCARALEYAHVRQVVHRDVKPANILVNQLGHIKLSDLGLAKPLDEEEDLSLTASGVGVGTPQFMAPEQSLNAKRADHRADIYSLGCVLYFLLTGHLPFEGDNPMALLHAKESGIFPPARRFNPEVPARLDLILDKIMARDLRVRYQHCSEVIAHIDQLGLAHEHLSFNPLHRDPVTEPAHPSGADLEILLVDDSAEDVLLLQDLLEQSGLSTNLNIVREAAEARAFLDRGEGYAWAPRPGLLLLGRSLRRRGGPALCATLRGDVRFSATPVILLAEAGHAADVARAYAADPSAPPQKPGALRQLKQLLAAAAAGPKMQVLELAADPSES